MAFDPGTRKAPATDALGWSFPRRTAMPARKRGARSSGGVSWACSSLRGGEVANGPCAHAAGAVLFFEGLSMELSRFTLKRRTQCSACGDRR